jgi:hypothetical protein
MRNPFKPKPIILCCFADLHPETERSVKEHAPTAIMADTSGSLYAYRDVLKEHWTGERDLVVIEQDIEITADVVPAFRSCSKPWCTFSYQGPSSLGYLYRGLGCAKFSAKLQRKIPFSDFIEYGMTWKVIDGYISRILWVVNGISPHVHGHVEHHHKYEPAPHCVEWQPDGRRFIFWNDLEGRRDYFVREHYVPDWAGRG